MNSRIIFVNTLTFLRVPLIFSWLVFAILEEYRPGFWATFLAGASMFLSGVTDFFDGYLARRWKAVSQLGKMADPLMDKIFYVVTFPALTWQIAVQQDRWHALAMLAFTILYILRDLWVTFMRSVGTLYGADVQAMWLGKVRTALSFPAAGWVYAYLVLHSYVPEEGAAWNAAWRGSCFAVELFMIVLNVVSFCTYTRAYLPYLKKALERK